MSETADRPDRPGLRERKKRQARTAMTEAALQMFWDGGYDTTTLEELVDRAEVSMRTFFRYFESKQAVALAAEQELWDAFLSGIRQNPINGELIDVLRRGITSALMSMDDDWDRRFITTRGLAATAPELFDASNLTTLCVQRAAVEILEERLGRDSRDDVRLRLVCDMALSAWRTGAQTWVRGGRRHRGTAQRPQPQPRATLVQLVDASFAALHHTLDLSTSREGRFSG